ncbi:MAG: transposase, partial [Acidobacteria bacterium]|nr:transposase [Acidobacteriota bacterium]
TVHHILEGSLPSHRITGLNDEQFEELTTRLEARIVWDQEKGRPRKLTLRQALRAILLYERQNMTQEVIAWTYGVSQSYISAMTKFLEPHIETVLAEFVPDAAESLPGRVSCVDGALMPCWSYRAHPELYSGKHRTTGHLVQLATDLDGDVRAISDAYPGSWHDSHAYDETGWADHIGDEGGIGDKAYVGTGLVTPRKKPPGGELSIGDKDCNKEINGLRSAVERGIAHVKTWRIFHTDYRRPFRTFAQAFKTTRALYFFSATF